MGHTGTDLHLPQEPSPCPTERQARPAQLWVFIDVEGRVRNAVLHESSGDEEIDRAALLAVRDLEFTPALLPARRERRFRSPQRCGLDRS